MTKRQQQVAASMVIYNLITQWEDLETQNDEQAEVTTEVIAKVEKMVINYSMIPVGNLGDIIEHVKQNY
ncbi:hypothetical protein SAMN04515674_12174 [Pseudarcicella hirudinis]|uniref:Uncharacterized protein n=1 Tax=Pseudarcicella hirudinis TaxID=1079859 RepID=A0A1I5X686_9BACT|nr:hypothetical protein [Pseudarcicella hirudinis]SFQ27401.1 hypothetical protein SAMN04515674_113160 [Pseudarcicella hirudinis]SFQ47744.1 hypothetical protein SAMN04515674_12174 [Pseudarcicella hirudinis]